MHRVGLASRSMSSTAGRGAVRVSRRRLATEASEASTVTPKKKPRIFRRIFWTTATLTGTFYVGSTFVSFNNQTYYNFFNDHVPLGQSMLEYAETHHWDTLTVATAIEYTKDAVISVQRFVTNSINGAPSAIENAKHMAEQKAGEARDAAVKTYESSKERAKAVASNIKTDVRKVEDKITGKQDVLEKHREQQIADELLELVHQAEDALAGKIPPPAVPAAPAPAPADTPKALETPPESPPVIPAPEKVADNVYTEPLPVGFEPPPGFQRPAPPPKKEAPPPEPPAALPLIAPSIADVSDPIIKHLAGTIDDLASYLKSNPNAASQITPVLEAAKGDLSSLVDKIETVKDEERAGLQAKMDEQTREYTIKMIELEMEAQDKLDSQEDEFRKAFDQHQVELTRAYRAKLDNELKTHLEIINERLKEEVIAQGIELQRRWIREIKVRVEQERGGRLAKLDELSTQLKRLERIALDNSVYLDENIRIHALWTAVRTLTSSALSSPVRKPFREELRILRHVATAREDPVTSAALDALESTEVPDVGVEPFADLASWFTTSVAPKVSNVALVPDQDAGLLSHLASHLLSSFRFKRHGLVSGDDVLSVLARAEYYLNEKDLDSATRELNQLKGTAQVLLSDWLEAARRRLEVQQVLEVVQTQATLASLLLV
ncbi:mitochondrial inner membrane protein Mitofilin [Desarmillaria tabescens]|uniref:MICOS complex subunit MIC60 n=1 Tax=Armillaria tabescens TaxID=1929756 RepID=A0AA39NPS4_ARMTA|nr:mitochondrial inner membrane protein Mitofilin [Desarmillaria tabescens]KAK0469614.1 mitochondrial inner membrane protein Mitofilin [Desarmillaria tabescens]